MRKILGPSFYLHTQVSPEAHSRVFHFFLFFPAWGTEKGRVKTGLGPTPFLPRRSREDYPVRAGPSQQQLEWQ